MLTSRLKRAQESTIKILIMTSVHHWDDARIFYREAISLSKQYEVELHAIADFAFKVQNSITIHGLPKPKTRSGRMINWLRLLHRTWVSKPDIIHIHDPDLIPLGLLISIVMGKKVIYDIHENVSVDILTKLWMPRVLRRFMSSAMPVVETLMCRGAALIIVAGEDIHEQSHIARFEHKVAAVKNYPISLPCLHNDYLIAPGKPLKLVYSGSLSPFKGIVEIIRAVKLFSKEEVNLTLIGKFTYATFREKVIKLIGDDNQVSIRYPMPYPVMLEYLTKYDIGLICFQPFPHNIGALRGRNNKIYEYMQAGLAIIGSNFPYWKRFIESQDCGIAVDPTDPRDIARAIKAFLSSPFLMVQMGKNARQAACKKYSWASEEKKLLEVYENITGRKPEERQDESIGR